MLVLTVELDEAVRQVFQRACGGEHAVDERAAAALRRNLAAHQQLFPTALEDGLDSGGLLAGAHQVA